MKQSLKFRVIFNNKNNYSVMAMCKFFGVSRSGYYYFISHNYTTPREEFLLNQIKQCQKEVKNTYGYRRVHIWLKHKNIYVNAKTVLRIMKKYDLLSHVRRKKKWKQMGKQAYTYENLLNRNFNSIQPNKKWVTDISYIHTEEGVLYLSIIRDLCNNAVVAHKTGTEQDVNLVLETINMAIRKEKAANGLVLHSDQGFQYTSRAYFNLTKRYNITPSMSRRGNCYDNAMAENFFSIIKTECIYNSKPKTLNEAKERIDEYIKFYNTQRIQLKTEQPPLAWRPSY